MIAGTSNAANLALEQDLDDRFVTYILEIEKRALHLPGSESF
jgi:hypothetical protein